MKKTKINLLVNREDYRRYEKYFAWMRTTVVIMIVVFVVAAGVFFYISLTQNQQYNNLLARKQTLLLALNNRQTDQAKLTFIESKYQSINTFMKDDAHSLPYYNLLNTAIATSTQTATLKSFKIDKNRNVTFIVGFSNFNELMNFFRFVESDQFLKNFENVTLKSFAAIGGKENKKDSYELNFAGKFIPLK